MMWLKKILIALCVVQTASAELTNGLYAAFETSMGSFTCRLDYAEAPLTCANFVGLAEGSQHWVSPEGAVRADPFYDGLIFHRVIDGFMIQGGCPLGNGRSGPGYAFPDQISTNLTHRSAGILSMANSGPNSNGSQFFITLDPTTWLDGKHAVFGEVIDGMDIVYDIGRVAVTNSSVPVTDVVMQSVRIIRIGDEAEEFNILDEPLPEVLPLSLQISETVSAATSNQCEQFLFSSTNLIGWELTLENYSLSAGEDIALVVPTNQACGFYRGAEVFHELGVTNEVADHVLTLDLGSIVVFAPNAAGGGTCSYNGAPGTIQEWRYDPANAGFMFFSDIMVPFSLEFEYLSDTNGNVTGWFYSSGWNPLSGTFTDVPLSP